jgi:hypothetical protein
VRIANSLRAKEAPGRRRNEQWSMINDQCSMLLSSRR